MTSEGEGWVPGSYLHPPDGANEPSVVGISSTEGVNHVINHVLIEFYFVVYKDND